MEEIIDLSNDDSAPGSPNVSPEIVDIANIKCRRLRPSLDSNSNSSNTTIIYIEHNEERDECFLNKTVSKDDDGILHYENTAQTSKTNLCVKTVDDNVIESILKKYSSPKSCEYENEGMKVKSFQIYENSLQKEKTHFTSNETLQLSVEKNYPTCFKVDKNEVKSVSDEVIGECFLNKLVSKDDDGVLHHENTAQTSKTKLCAKTVDDNIIESIIKKYSSPKSYEYQNEGTKVKSIQIYENSVLEDKTLIASSETLQSSVGKNYLTPLKADKNKVKSVSDEVIGEYLLNKMVSKDDDGVLHHENAAQTSKTKLCVKTIDDNIIESIIKKYSSPKSCEYENEGSKVKSFQIYENSVLEDKTHITSSETLQLSIEKNYLTSVKADKNEVESVSDEMIENLAFKYGKVRDTSTENWNARHLKRLSEKNLTDDVQQKHRRKSPTEKEKAGREREKAKAEKQTRKKQLKIEAEREKAIRKALLIANKNMKPEECLKFITVHIDLKIINERYGGEILNTLQTAEITYQTEQQLLPGIITWSRNVQSHLINDNNQLVSSSKNIETDEILIVKSRDDLIEMVSKNLLLPHIREIKNMFANKKLLLAIYDLKAYYRFLKNQNKKQFRSELEEMGKNIRADKNRCYEEAAIVKRRDVEDALTEIQIFCSCSHKMVDSVRDMAQLILQLTKAAAQVPYKLEKQLKQQQLEWFIAGDNKDCVHVDKNGNGLRRLWPQQLTVFPLARLETAEAIVSRYPTPLSLMQAYKNCSSQKEGEKLLQAIAVRRAVGPLTNERKIGPELSRKIYKFFTSIDADAVL